MSNKVTLLPEYIDIVQQPGIEFYSEATNLMDVFDTYTGELSVCIDFEKSKVNVDIIESLSKLYKALNDTSFNISVNGSTYKFDDIFKLFFIEKFQSLSNNIRALITSSFSDNNVYFNNFSDDTGNITNTTSIVDNSTSPYFDINGELFDLPCNVAASLYNKISKNELTISINMGLLTDALLKHNISKLQYSSSIDTAKTPHGDNLITDNIHINRVIAYSDTINSQLKNIIGDMADFIQFFKGVNYRDQDEDRAALYLTYNATIERVSVVVDALKNRLEASTTTSIRVS